MDGFLVIDKPKGLTSHDVVNAIRRIVNQKKVGHTGTLDPFATGVLPVALGEATKAIPFLDESCKEYKAVMHLGVITDTQDCTGNVIGEKPCFEVTAELLETTFSQFVGVIKQVPPMFSALKRSGVPLYKLARQGQEIPRDPRDIQVFSLTLEKIALPKVFFSVRCSRGTYVRTLANDIGEKLGCGAHLSNLRRTSSGIFSIDDSISLDEVLFLQKDKRLPESLISLHRSLSHLKDVVMTEKGAARVKVGALPGPEGYAEIPSGEVAAGEKVTLSIGERLIAVAEKIPSSESRNLRLLRVFN